MPSPYLVELIPMICPCLAFLIEGRTAYTPIHDHSEAACNPTHTHQVHYHADHKDTMDTHSNG